MQKCGVFNKIKRMDGFLNSSNLQIYDNSIQWHKISSLYNAFDCEKPITFWASSTAEPFFEFGFPGRELKLKGFIYSRANDSWYPTSLEVLGQTAINKWERICTIPNITIPLSESKTLECTNGNYYSAFKFKQTSNSANAEYIEVRAFDLFGNLVSYNRRYITCKKGHEFVNRFLYFYILSISR